MILTDKLLDVRFLKDTEQIKQAYEWWEKGDWKKIDNKLLMHPFKPENLSGCSYDICVGNEYVSLREPDEIKELKENGQIFVSPGETVLILSDEFVGLPKGTMAMVVPRARWIFEGAAICPSRIEPTWYGRLLIAFTNHANYPIVLPREEPFATCCFEDVEEIQKVLTKDRLSFLGRRRIKQVDFTHARKQDLLAPNGVTREELDKVVKLYGKPYDVIRGAIEVGKNEVLQYIDRERAPDIVEQAASAAVDRAFKEQQKLLRILITGILSFMGIGVAFIGWFLYLSSKK